MLNIISDYIPGEHSTPKNSSVESVDLDLSKLVTSDIFEKGADFNLRKTNVPQNFKLGTAFSYISSKIDVEILKANLESTLDDLFKVFSQINNTNKNIFIDAVKLNVSLSANGEVSILSMIKGGVSSLAGIEFTIKFKEN